VRKVVTRKISVDFECRDTIESGRRSEGLDTRLSSRKSDEARHRAYLDSERGIAANAGGAGLLRCDQAGGAPGGGSRT
jgi:hypothetical protein